ncbi:hypothetical protein [Cohaesibacter intestini]|uniref:hypothetical protein n=1 Tax=Cohaesibacter intestini TaxID=2211145 RepID=UPI003CCB6C0D
MPTKQAFLGQRHCMIAGRIQHHLYDTIDMPTDWNHAADVYSKSAGNRRSDFHTVQIFAFDRR